MTYNGQGWHSAEHWTYKAWGPDFDLWCHIYQNGALVSSLSYH